MTEKPGLTFAAVSKKFGDTEALISFDLAIQPGEFVTLLGPSGCGKTTALRIAAGFEEPTTGRVLLGNIDITRQPPHTRNMGMVFQSYSLFPHLNVLDNVGFGLKMRGTPRQSIRRTAEEMLELVRLGDLADRFPHQLSGGQQQRVALARALAIAPDVLLLDEPLSALDAKVRTDIRDEIRSLTRRLGTTTIFVTHDQEEALGLSDRVCVMNVGRVEQVGSPAQIYDHPASDFVASFVGEMNRIRIGEESLSVRPERVRLVDSKTARHSGRVESTTFHGSHVRYVVRMDDGQSIRVSRPHNPDDPLLSDAIVGIQFEEETKA
jgi:putative spermidine/putrescine transport system ATP-binding protein